MQRQATEGADAVGSLVEGAEVAVHRLGAEEGPALGARALAVQFQLARQRRLVSGDDRAPVLHRGGQ